MLPKFVLLVCTAFVLFLLRLERKQSPQLSHVSWIPTIWMLLISSKPLGIWFGTGGVDMESGSPLDRDVLTIFLGLGLIILAFRHFNLFETIRKNIWVILLISFMLVSILWSNMPYISFKRWTREIIAVVMAFLCTTEPDPRQALQSIFRRTIYVLIPFSYVLIHYYPEYGREYAHWSGALMWTGVASQKNGLALICLVAFFYLFWTFFRRWKGRDISVAKYQIFIEIFLLSLTTWLFMGPQHNFSYSATSTSALVIGLIAFIGFLWMKKLGVIINVSPLMIIITFIIIYGTLTPMIGRLSLFDISSTLGRTEDLTGRSEIWAIIVPFAMERPLLGYGIGGFWTTEMRDLASSHAHNGYLDMILNLGYFGLFLLTIFLLSCSWKAQKVMTRDFDWGVLWMCFLIIALVHNIAESSIETFTNPLTAILLFLLVSVPEYNKQPNQISD